MHTFAPTSNTSHRETSADIASRPLQQLERSGHEPTHLPMGHPGRAPASQVGFNFGQIPFFGNRSGGIIQPKLKVNAPGDRYEQEADRVADQVVRMTDVGIQRKCINCGREEQIQGKPLAAQISPIAQRMPQPVQEEKTPRTSLISNIQRKCANCEEEEKGLIQTKSQNNTSRTASQSLSNRIQHTKGHGQAMDASTQSFMSSRFGSDFSSVKIHTDNTAAQMNSEINAQAFTIGQDVYFNQGNYNPNSGAGKRLLAHELTHVVQQNGQDHQKGPGTNVQRSETMLQRAISPELDKIEDLLSYGFLDWAITDSEAVEAFEILKSLPRFQQAVFFSNQKFVDRLKSNLPDDRVEALTFMEEAVASVKPSTSIIEQVRSKLSYGLFDWAVTDKEAEEALDLIKKLPEDQKGIALGSIDYGRLMDNLPDSRKKELIDLLAKHLGTGGEQEQDEKLYPFSTPINSISFVSDHQTGVNNMMKDNNSNWSNSGNPIKNPEWSRSKGEVQSYPISHSKDQNVRIDLNLNVAPEDAPLADMKLIGKSDAGYLSFNYAGTMKGGSNQTIPMVSSGKLPNEITHIKDKKIDWIMEWRDWKREIGQTGPHEIFVTVNEPRLPAEVTLNRMALAVKLGEDAATLDGHTLVRMIMEKWPAYNLDIFYSNAWLIAENMNEGADCGTIARFVLGVIQMLGVPGIATPLVVYADPDNPSIAKEDIWGTSGIGLWKYSNRVFDGRSARPRLIDGNECANMYEAALKFNDGSTTEYYPGGVDFWYSVGGVDRRIKYTSAHIVLHIFDSLAWISGIGRIEKVHNYPEIPALPFENTKHKVGDRLNCK